MKRFSLGIVLIISCIIVSAPMSAAALSGSDFRADNIIQDSVFFNGNSMSDNDIQFFLNSKMPNCDTDGSEPYGNTTRAAYGASIGVPPPYTCLKDYTQNMTAQAPNAYCDGGVGSGQRSAAQIIGEVARACNINPRALIVLIQKEQSLLTDEWPWPIQYRSATGYGCPDTAACDSTYYGFFNQVYNAAKQLQRYVRQPQNFNYAAGRLSFVAYQANRPDCGGTDLRPQNGATAALYNYTPYQPNAAALANLYGTGDECSAYGNRNFWRLYNDWFGSSQMETPWAWALVSQDIHVDQARTTKFTNTPTVAPGGKIYVTIKAHNIGTSTWRNNSVRLGTNSPRDRTSQFSDSSWLSSKRPAALKEASVSPGQIGTFEFALNAPQSTGSYRENFNIVAEGVSWLSNQDTTVSLNVVQQIQPGGSDVIMQSGNTLNRGEYKLSRDTSSILYLQNDGNLVLYSNFKAAWNSGTIGHNASQLRLQNDGNLVLYNQNNQPIWNSNSFNNGQSRLSLQGDGNMVLYRQSDSVATFSTATSQIPHKDAYVNSTVGTGVLMPGQKMQSANRNYSLVLQNDGNLVLYSTSRAIWNSGTFGRPVSYLSKQSDGNLVLYDKDNRPLWNTGTHGRHSSELMLQSDGNLVLYDSKRVPVWQTYTFGQL